MSTLDTAAGDPRAWTALTAAATVIGKAISERQAVCVWGHDDIDGAAGTAILCSVLRDKTETVYFIPPRGGSHYGLDKLVIDQLYGSGVGLIVTVDCGISSSAEAEYARSKGMALVITDHHELPAELPQADVVVNPKIREAGAPCADLSGAGVALYLSALISGAGGDWPGADPLRLAWAALATVSDRVALRGENRAVLKSGLPCLAADPVFAAIAREIGLDLSRGLSHRIVADNFVALLAGAASEGSRHPLVELLNGDVDPAMIRSRWEAQREWRAKLLAQTEAKKGRLNPERDSINLVVDEQLVPDMIGPLAGRLRDATGYPAVVIGLRNGLHVGECRGSEPFDLSDMLRALNGNFVQAGGHKQAAGFTVKPDKLGETLVAIEEYAENHKGQIQGAKPTTVIAYRFERPGDVLAVAAELAGSAPYGPGTPEPVCEIAALPGSCETGESYWLDDLMAMKDTGSRAATASIDVTHTGKIALRMLS